MSGNFTCPQCGRDLDYSTRDGWVCPVHGQQGVPREIDTSTYPEDVETPSMFEVEA